MGKGTTRSHKQSPNQMYVAFNTSYGWFINSELGYFLVSSSHSYVVTNKLLSAVGITNKTPLNIGIYNNYEQKEFM